MISKKLLVVAAAAGLTAATAVPALALENEFHGMFRLKTTMSNFETGGAGLGLNAAGTLPDFGNAPETKFYVDQRTRLMYIAKANDDLKLVTHFELDATWGVSSYTTGRNTGGSLGADSTNIETKSAYLDFNIPGIPVNVKGGIQPWTDAYKGIFFGNDAAGMVATAKYGAFTNQVGWFRFDDRNSATNPATGISGANKQTRDLLFLDGKLAINKSATVGASYYALNDDSSIQAATAPGGAAAGVKTNALIHTVGVNGQATFGPVTVDGFGLYQFGNIKLDTGANRQHVNAFAGNLGVKAKLGPGTLKTNFLYTSGDRSIGNSNYTAFYPIKNKTSAQDAENAFYAGDMRILLRDKWGSNDDRAIVNNMDNLGQGIIAGFLGYDGAVDKFIFNANVGCVANANDNASKPLKVTNASMNSSQYMGTEINAEVGYKLYDNLTASLQGAYVILGDYFKDTQGTATSAKDPDNPYLGRVVLNYAF